MLYNEAVRSPHWRRQSIQRTLNYALEIIIKEVAISQLWFWPPVCEGLIISFMKSSLKHIAPGQNWNPAHLETKQPLLPSDRDVWWDTFRNVMFGMNIFYTGICDNLYWCFIISKSAKIWIWNAVVSCLQNLYFQNTVHFMNSVQLCIIKNLKELDF